MYAQRRRSFAVVLGVAAVLTAGCKKSAPPQEQTSAPSASSPTASPSAAEFKVSGIELGKGIGADKRVTSATSTFKPKDTIYASVSTEGAASNKTMTAKWTYEDGQVVDEGSESIAATGPARTEFHIAKPSGWPAGKYQVEIALDGAPAGTREFEVKP
jgi:hypothetical protein